jgi:hypothetical protein
MSRLWNSKLTWRHLLLPDYVHIYFLSLLALINFISPIEKGGSDVYVYVCICIFIGLYCCMFT